AGSDGDVAHRRIGNAGAEMQFAGIGRHEREQRVRILPQNVGVENPTILESKLLGLTCKSENAVHGQIRFQGEAELHSTSPEMGEFSTAEDTGLRVVRLSRIMRLSKCGPQEVSLGFSDYRRQRKNRTFPAGNSAQAEGVHLS